MLLVLCKAHFIEAEKKIHVSGFKQEKNLGVGRSDNIFILCKNFISTSKNFISTSGKNMKITE